MKKVKTEEEFIKYMHKIYPNDNNTHEREVMMKAYTFLNESDEIERKKIYKLIGEKMEKMGYVSLSKRLTKEKLWQDYKLGNEYQINRLYLRMEKLINELDDIDHWLKKQQ
jgi:hypothetical protein